MVRVYSQSDSRSRQNKHLFCYLFVMLPWESMFAGKLGSCDQMIERQQKGISFAEGEELVSTKAEKTIGSRGFYKVTYL